MMSPEQRNIAMQTMKKAKNTDTEDIPKEEEEATSRPTTQSTDPKKNNQHHERKPT